MSTGASERIEDDITELKATVLNTLDMGGNVYPSPNGGLNVRVTAIRGMINNAEVDYLGASTDQLLTASQTNYIYLSETGVLTINTTGFPSYPGTKHFRLATAVTSASAITSITDRRWKFWVT